MEKIEANAEDNTFVDEAGPRVRATMKPEMTEPNKITFEVAGGRRVTVDCTNLTAEEIEMVQDMDIDRDGNVDMAEVVKHLTSNKKTKTKVDWLRKVLALVVGCAVAVIVFNTIVTIVAIETTKESHVEGGQMVDLDDNIVKVASSDTALSVNGELVGRSNESSVVKTGRLESFATLFDLPYFDMKTLNEVRYLTLSLGDGNEAGVSIGTTMKKAGSKVVTFTSVSGDTIVVDAGSMLAVVTLSGVRHMLDGTVRQRRLLKEKNYIPKLYSEDDFFTQKNGFDGRRMTSASDNLGYASVGLAAAAAVLDYQNEQGRNYETVHIVGQVQTLDADGLMVGTPREVNAYYNKTVGSNSRVRVTSPDGASQVQDWTTRFVFDFNTNSQLTKCQHVNNMLDPGSTINSVVITAIEQDGGVLRGTDTLGDPFIMTVSSTNFDLHLNQIHSLAIPTPEQCKALNPPPITNPETVMPNVNVTDSPPIPGRRLGDGRRLWGTGGDLSKDDL